MPTFIFSVTFFFFRRVLRRQTAALGSRAFTFGQADCKAQVAKPENQLEASVAWRTQLEGIRGKDMENEPGKKLLGILIILIGILII